MTIPALACLIAVFVLAAKTLFLDGGWRGLRGIICGSRRSAREGLDRNR